MRLVDLVAIQSPCTSIRKLHAMHARCTAGVMAANVAVPEVVVAQVISVNPVMLVRRISEDAIRSLPS